MYEIHHIKVGSLIRIVTFITTVLYIAVGVVFSLLFETVRGLFLGNFVDASTGALSFLLVWMAGTLVVIIVMIILSAIIAGLYNLFAEWWGGLRIDLVKNDRSTHTTDKPSIRLVKNENNNHNVKN